jgi:hypothetical protein
VNIRLLSSFVQKEEERRERHIARHQVSSALHLNYCAALAIVLLLFLTELQHRTKDIHMQETQKFVLCITYSERQKPFVHK